MKKTRLILASLACAALALPAVSLADSHQMPDTYFYAGGHVSQYYYDFNSHENNYGLTETTLPGAQFGWRFAPNWSIQGSWERNEYSEDKGTSYSSNGYMNVSLISGRYHFADTSLLGFEPYMGLAAGENMRDAHGVADDNRQTVVGPVFGAQTLLVPHLSLDVGARPLWRMDEKSWDGEIYAGLNFLFGTSSKPAPVVAPTVADADNDGVPDSVDQCPSTAAGAQVDAKGCELDSDGDGVVNSADQCPSTPKGALVDDKGCQKVLTKDIHQTLYVQFALDKATVRQTSYPSIKRIGTLAKQYPSSALNLEGYTDSTGAASYNQKLSKKRAEAVKQVLVNTFGVDAGRVAVEGRGEANPIASNKTKEGRAQNRRVEVVLKAQTKEAQFKK